MFKKTMVFCVILLLFFLVGCTLSLPIKKPLTSTVHYSQPKSERVVINVIDLRADKQFHKGSANLVKAINQGKIVFENMGEPVQFLAANLENEFSTRGIPVTFDTDSASSSEADMTLNIEVFQIVSHRVSGYSPWVVFHSFKGTLINGDDVHPIYAYFYEMRVPIMSMNEIIEPCFNRPISIITKEIVSKINKNAFKYSSTDDDVDALVDSIESRLSTEEVGLHLKFLELGSSNNPKAIEPLKKYANLSNQFLSACALTSIGFMASENEYDFLVEKFNECTHIAKFMALKSIGDIGTPKAKAFMEKVKNDPIYEKEGGLKACVDLYLN